MRHRGSSDNYRNRPWSDVPPRRPPRGIFALLPQQLTLYPYDPTVLVAQPTLKKQRRSTQEQESLAINNNNIDSNVHSYRTASVPLLPLDDDNATTKTVVILLFVFSPWQKHSILIRNRLISLLQQQPQQLDDYDDDDDDDTVLFCIAISSCSLQDSANSTAAAAVEIFLKGSGFLFHESTLTPALQTVLHIRTCPAVLVLHQGRKVSARREESVLMRRNRDDDQRIIQQWKSGQSAQTTCERAYHECWECLPCAVL